MTSPPKSEVTLGELSTLSAQLEELMKRVTKVAESYLDTSDSRVAHDLFTAERALHGARRALHQATDLLKKS